jgi:hypothetical protein
MALLDAGVALPATADWDSAAAQATLRIAGRLVLTLLNFDAAHGEYEICAQMFEPSLSGGAGPSGATAIARDASREAAIALPFRFVMATNGRITGFRFPEAMPSQPRQVLAEIIAQLHAFDVRAATEPYDGSPQLDRTGEWLALFEWQSRNPNSAPYLSRTKTAYLDDEKPDKARRTLTIERSASRATWRNGWLDTATIDESIIINAKARARVSFKVDLQRTSDVQVPACSDDLGALSWPGSAGGTRTGPPQRFRSFAELVTQLTSLADNGGAESREFFGCREDLAALLTRDSQALQLVLQQIEASADTNGAAALIGVLGRAGGLGSVESAVALASMFEAPGSTTLRRQTCLLSAFQLGASTALAMVPVAIRCLDGENDPVLRGQAILTAGGLAGLPDGSKESSDQIGDALARVEAWADTEGQIDMWIRGACQSHCPQLEASVVGRLDDPDDSVRAVAYEEVAGLGTPGAVRAVLERAASAETDEWRARAVEGLAACAHQASVRAQLEELLRTDLDDVEREVVREILQHHAEFEPDS